MKQTLKCIIYSCDFLKIQIANLRRFEFGAKIFEYDIHMRITRVQNHQNKTRRTNVRLELEYWFLKQTSFLLLQAKSEDELENEKAFLEADRVWLVHRDGFAAAGLLKDEAGEGMVRVQLDYNGDIFNVEEDDVELANPPGFDKVEDLAQLR